MVLFAPYNDTMCLGMGFNSFTQQPCILGAVKPRSETEPTLKTVNTQSTTWTGQFVDNISEVTDALNISGSFFIQSDAGGKAPCFFNATKFKESDVNYFIQGRVTKCRVLAPDLTEFDPVPNLPDSDFTRVYGDSFISGFIKGAELSALVSIKLKDRSNTNAVKRQLEKNLGLEKSELVSAQIPDGSDGTIAIDGEITISVSWRGGGLGGNRTTWTLEGLKEAIQGFSEQAMAYPIVRLSAILTKYTGLRSFYAQCSKGGPLDYKNTGIYVSALLDAYMDYKAISRKIQQAISEVEWGHSVLTEKTEMGALTQLSLEAKTNYEAACRQTGEPLPTDGSMQATTSTGVSSPPPYISRDSVESCESPMPLHDFAPYKANIFGLEKAQRDCQLEMTKIVREVGLVAQDPKLACDPSRVWRYLSPALFRALLPTMTDLGKQKSEQQAAEEAKKVRKQLENDLIASKRELEELQKRHQELQETSQKALGEQANALEVLRSELNPYCPVDLCQPVRIRAYTSKKSMDYAFHDPASLSLHQYDTVDHPSQKFEINSLGSKGFSIRHCASGRYVTTGDVQMEVGESPTAFTFERLYNADGSPDGTVRIHLVDRDSCTLTLGGFPLNNGAKLFGWRSMGNDADRWYIKGFHDFSI